MRTVTHLLTATLVAILLNGCEYKTALTSDHTVPIDPAVLGLWQSVAAPGQTAETKAELQVLRFSDTEYVVHYATANAALYFRAYPVTVANLKLVQVELLGSQQGPAGDTPGHFHVVTYAVQDGTLRMAVLNTAVVPATAASPDDLRRRLVAETANPRLFQEPQHFVRAPATP